ncbi:MAG: recombinase family protein [Clostridia bacterium]|nr:recombinase family protein [Clostridia bacterium]
MMAKIIKLKRRKVNPGVVRTAAYARVSKESERSTHSLAAQVSYYSNLIQSNPEWEYAGVYIDSYITGSKTSGRDGFNKLIAECDAGNIDLVLVKSISRFARNTVDLLNTVRHLKEIGVAVVFEKEHINTLSADGEFLLTVLASFAQEEITSMSNNIKWSLQKKFREGLPAQQYKVFGYDWQDDRMIINEDEAVIVRRIFSDFLAGQSVTEIRNTFEKEYTDLKFSRNRISNVLKNEVYIGRLIMQKTYSASPITKKEKRNNGEMPMYVVEDHHEPIIDAAVFEAAQTEYKRRAEFGAVWNKYINTSPLTGKLKCGCCGSNYIKDVYYKSNGSKERIWVCKRTTHGHAAECKGRRIPDKTVKAKFIEVYGAECDEAKIAELVSKIVVSGENLIEYHFKDGTVAAAEWELTGNKDRWTDEERSQRSRYVKEHPINTGRMNCFTSKIQCGVCGENFRRHRIRSTGAYGWGCASGKRVCGLRWVREGELKRVIKEALELSEFDEELYKERIKRIVVLSNNELTLYFKDGTEKTVPWNSRKSNAVK